MIELMSSCNFKEATLERKKKTGVVRVQKDSCKLAPIELIVETNPCPLCVEQEMVMDVIDTLQLARSRDEIVAALKKRLALPGGEDRLHNVSSCFLPKSREIIQRRYQ